MVKDSYQGIGFSHADNDSEFWFRSYLVQVADAYASVVQKSRSLHSAM